MVRKLRNLRNGRCWQCGTSLPASEFIRSGSCTHCATPTRVCKNCHLYDPGSYNECREPQAEHVTDKERANFCDWFAIRPGTKIPATVSSEDARQAARDAAEALFR
jgi:hypothetical protein